MLCVRCQLSAIVVVYPDHPGPFSVCSRPPLRLLPIQLWTEEQCNAWRLKRQARQEKQARWQCSSQYSSQYSNLAAVADKQLTSWYNSGPMLTDCHR
eukprot:3769553-Amphidinium_carterae.1